ncbi:MAG: phytoene/squalene synthase family protein [Gammaproteobacteria bacterium]
MSEQHPTARDEIYQHKILQGVSRTFALTIPQLPGPLARVVGNAYLLCRIADTIEDDKQLTFEQKREFSEAFIQVVVGKLPADKFAQTLSPLLSESNSDAELDLIENTAAVIRITRSFNERQRLALEKCVRIMADGMAEYQESNVANGLADQADMDIYCYYVAGVVGEMLTELFCDYSEEINQHYADLQTLAISFGQGLQMTNILKDIWDDQKRNMCWLPRSVFEQHGSDIAALQQQHKDQNFQNAIAHLIGVAYGHLENALQYTLLIPKNETGLRRFCLYAIGMAVLTLRKINRRRDFTTAEQVKISRRSVKLTVALSNLLAGNDYLLRQTFRLATRSIARNKPL